MSRNTYAWHTYKYRKNKQKLLDLNLEKYGNYTCEVCNKKHLYKNKTGECIVRDNTVTIDHIIPVSKGGSNDLDNLKVTCWECNNRKGNDY